MVNRQVKIDVMSGRTSVHGNSSLSMARDAPPGCRRPGSSDLLGGSMQPESAVRNVRLEFGPERLGQRHGRVLE